MSAISTVPVSRTFQGLDYSVLKQRQQATWASGDFSVVAARILYQAEQPRAFDALPTERQAALNDDMLTLVRRYDRNGGSGPFAIAAEYLETVIIGK